MQFKVTHINAAGMVRRARVPANSNKEAIDAVEQAFGPALRLACVLLVRPALRLVDGGRGGVCG